MSALSFDPWAALKCRVEDSAPAKAAKADKVAERNGNTLAGLATLAGVASPDLKTASVPPADPAALLAYIRNALHCRVTLAGETVTIGPTHRCPPPVLAAVQAVLPEIRAILEDEGSDFLAAILGASNGDADAIPLDLSAGQDLPAEALAGIAEAPDVLLDRAAIAAEGLNEAFTPSVPPPDLVERLAAAMAAPRPWQHVVGDPAPALSYYQGEARRRLERLDETARGLLVQAVEAEARRYGEATH